jgi:hypothetical protein
MNLFLEAIVKYKDINDPRLKWDVIKMDIRGSSISYASYKSKLKRQQEMDLLKQMKDLEPRINNNPIENDLMLYASLTKELEQLNNENMRGIQLRAQGQHMELSETNSKYFLSKEKSQAEIKSITKLRLEDGTEITDTKEILNEQKRFYSKLYTEPNTYKKREVHEADQFFFENNPIASTVTDEDKELLDIPLTYEEIANATKDLPNNKSPGSDGLQINFYKAFWPKIKNLVCESILAAVSEKKMSIEQRRGILTLIPKKDKDIRELKNWRPISLLNSDYKIFAKAIATRLQKVLPYIINTDQSGCIKGRSAHNNILSTIDIIKHVNTNKLPGFLAFIDYEKAFDSINWSFTFKCLDKFNFRKYFIECIRTMYNDITIAVSNSGFLTEFFAPSRGIRQGCPVSANIFVIVAEFLANAIRKSKKIRGIFIGNKQYKITQYADDTCLYLSDIESLKAVFTILAEFTKSSGLKVNRDKSEALGIGASSNFRHKDIGIKWPETSIKRLEIYINNDYEKIVLDNYKERLDKVNNLVDTW